MNCTLKSYAVLVIAALLISARAVVSSAAPTPPAVMAKSDALAAKIKRAESNLSSNFVTTETKPWTIQERMQHFEVPGVSIAVINNGQIEWLRAYGVRDVSSREPVTTDTLFQAASISKPVSALGAMLLVSDGKLSLDENVNQKLRSWKIPENEFTARTPVTLRGLLSHTAATTVHGFMGYPVDAMRPTVPQILEGAKPANSAAVRVDVQPGTLWRYSGGGTTIVQQLVEDVSTQPFASFMQSRVLKPAGMLASAYEQPLSPARAKLAASGHIDGTRIVGKWHVYPELAAAGLWTTPRDLATFALLVQRAANGQTLPWLSTATAKQMVTAMSPVPSEQGGWALGFGVRESKGVVQFFHGGSNEGFQCNLLMSLKEGRGIVVMTNGSAGSRLIEEINNAVAQVYGWAEMAPDVRKTVKLAPAALRAFEGEYAVEGALTLSMIPDGDQLLARASGLGWDRLHASSDLTFVAEMSGITVEFHKDINGNIEAVSLPTPAGVLRAAKLPGKRYSLTSETLYLRGTMNEWGTSLPMTKLGGDRVSAEVDLKAGAYKFKIASQDYQMVDLGSGTRNFAAPIGSAFPLKIVGSDIRLNIQTPGRYVFTLDTSNTLAPSLVIDIVIEKKK
jgi:CubicO group peptidase (beta-lactamase class C family)